MNAIFARLRALERKLAPQLAEIAVTEHANKLANEWQDAVEEDRTPPDALDFARDLTLNGFYLPATLPRAINYLTGCYYRKTIPDPRRLFRILLPWCPHPPPAWA